MEFTLITGRTVAQGEAIEQGKNLEGFTTTAAIVELDPEDMSSLGVKDGQVVEVKSGENKVAVKARKSGDAPHRGVAFMPMGPWANIVVGEGTEGTGMPPFRGIRVEIEPSRERVLSATELVEKLYSRFLKEKR